MGFYMPLRIARCCWVESPWGVFPCGIKLVLESVDVSRFDHYLREGVPLLYDTVVERILLWAPLPVVWFRQDELILVLTARAGVQAKLWSDCRCIVGVDMFEHLDHIPTCSSVDECRQIQYFQPFCVVHIL